MSKAERELAAAACVFVSLGAWAICLAKSIRGCPAAAPFGSII